MNEKEFIAFNKGDLVRVIGKSLNYADGRIECVFGYIRDIRNDGSKMCMLG